MKIRFANKSKDAIIPVREAVTAHINYLIAPDGPHIVNTDGEIIHYLWLSESDLARLTEDNRAAKGLRLYFCRHNDTGELNIIAVPVGEEGHNVLVDGVGASVIANTLKPCPNDCPPLVGTSHTTHENSFSLTDLNRVKLDGFNIWCKPNKKTSGGNMWFRNRDTPSVAPEPPYDVSL